MPASMNGETGRKPHPVDVHVGTRLRLRRVVLGYSQERLATALGLTFQQIQKYEKGTNRISASRLFELGRILDVSVEYFYEGAELVAPLAPGAAKAVSGGVPPSAAREPEATSQRETLKLVSAFYRIKDPTVRAEALALLESLGPPERPVAPSGSDLADPDSRDSGAH